MPSSTTLRLPDALKADAESYASGLGISLNALCAVALRDYLDKRAATDKLPGALTYGAKPVRGQQNPPPAVAAAPAPLPVAKVGANQPCPCGSGQKYKRCHGKPTA